MEHSASPIEFLFHVIHFKKNKFQASQKEINILPELYNSALTVNSVIGLGSYRLPVVQKILIQNPANFIKSRIIRSLKNKKFLMNQELVEYLTVFRTSLLFFYYF